MTEKSKIGGLSLAVPGDKTSLDFILRQALDEAAEAPAAPGGYSLLPATPVGRKHLFLHSYCKSPGTVSLE